MACYSALNHDSRGGFANELQKPKKLKDIKLNQKVVQKTGTRGCVDGDISFNFKALCYFKGKNTGQKFNRTRFFGGVRGFALEIVFQII
jgi:hypothetical protein